MGKRATVIETYNVMIGQRERQKAEEEVIEEDLSLEDEDNLSLEGSLSLDEDLDLEDEGSSLVSEHNFENDFMENKNKLCCMLD
jgi:hypothetical protein